MSYRYVYMLRCSDGKIYTGNTGNLQNRLKRHRGGYVSFTRNRLPVELVTFLGFADKQKAYNFERYLKSGSGKAFAQRRLV